MSDQRQLFEFRLEVIGGPYDGVRGFAWQERPDAPLPAQLFVGHCDGAGQCGERACDEPHPSYWTDVEAETMPVDVYVYRLEERDEEAGVANYVIGPPVDELRENEFGVTLRSGDSLTITTTIVGS